MYRIRHLVEVVLYLAREIFEALRSSNELGELEERIQRAAQKAAGSLLAYALEEVDRRLMAKRDQKKLKVIGTRTRTLTTVFGDVRIRRRLYRDTKTKKAAFLLDEALGLESRARLSPRMSALALELGTEMPYRRASRILGYLVPGVSAMTVAAVFEGRTVWV